MPPVLNDADSDRRWLIDYARGQFPDATAAEAALRFARLDDPARDIAPYQTRLDDIARDLERAIANVTGGTGDPDARDLATALQEVIPGYHGFQGDGDNYDDIGNASLMQVIDRKRGLPVALSLLYLHAAARCGIDMTGIDFPGHFLLRLQAGGERVLIDPFHDGMVLGAAELRELLKAFHGLDAELQPEHYREASDIAVLLRLQNNIKVRAMRNGNLDLALDVVERCLLIAPDHGGLWHQAGALYARVGRDKEALEAFEKFLTFNQDPTHRQRIKILIAELTERLHPAPTPPSPAMPVSLHPAKSPARESRTPPDDSSPDDPAGQDR
ncbi:MAG: transglutaminase-like domain-containing protein [Pseudomonadota bacterium]